MPKQLLVAAAAAVVLSASVNAASWSLPRGVSSEDADRYRPHPSTGHFTCLNHPSITIPYTSVNDDYCDCPDGSDEPGTSACAGTPHDKLAIRGFYCANKNGHVGQYLPLGRVNDGVCDYEFCCDGSDEYLRVGGVVCEDRCKEVGGKVRELLREKWRVRNEGGRRKMELLKKAGVLRKEMEANVEALEKTVVALEEKVKGLEERVKVVEAEEREKEKAARRDSGGKGEAGNVGLVAQIAQERIEELRAALEKMREEERETREKLVEAEGILSGLKDTYNPNFNDEGVKTAVRKWEDYVAAGKRIGSGERNSAGERDLEELVSGEKIDWDELIGPVEEMAEKASGIEAYLPGGVRNWMHDKLDQARQVLVDNGLLAERPSSDTGPEPKAVTEAKAALASANSDLSSKRNSLNQNRADLNTSYGPGDIFRSLKDTCLSRDVGEYKYELCFFGKAHQRSLKDSSASFLGEHKRLDIVAPQASGLDGGALYETDDLDEGHEEKFSGWTLWYEGGARCWNGPERSARIDLYCAVENEIRSVVETEKCVYKYEVGTPVVCEGEEGAEEKVKNQVRDEL